MEADDAAAWNFYWSNATAFVAEFGLMAGRLAAQGLEGVAEEIFVSKLSAIHVMVADKRERMEKSEAGKEAPEVVIAGDENG